MSSQPLTDGEFDKIEEILDRFGDKRAMNLEQMDGFLAAIVCSPREITPSEFLPVIWGDKIINEEAFIAQPQLQEFIRLVLRHRNSIAHILRGSDVFTPLVFADKQGGFHGNDWAKGFLEGTKFCKDDWTMLMEDEEEGGALVPIFALAYENDPDPELRTYKEPVSKEQRRELVVGVSAGVMLSFQYFEAQRLLSKYPLQSRGSRQISRKVGRNESCPCGSGKKYKHCCGKLTLH
jgi:uncharacterized protein